MKKLFARVLILAAPLAALMASTVEAAETGWTVVVQQHVAVPAEAATPRAIASFGPFRVLDSGRAALVGTTDSASPAQFAAMLRAWPAIAELVMIECPGTEDDLANLRLGRMIRAAGITTRVPAGGSVRSGAVELFLAGRERHVDDGAEFAVHAWEDYEGRQAADYPANAPENRRYLAYYAEMGMDARHAASFYAMTNAQPFAQPRWMTAAEMRQWLGGAPAPAPLARPAPVLAYLDLTAALP